MQTIFAAYFKAATCHGPRRMDAAFILARELRAGSRERNTAIWQPTRAPQTEEIRIVPTQLPCIDEQPLTTRSGAISKAVKVRQDNHHNTQGKF